MTRLAANVIQRRIPDRTKQVPHGLAVNRGSSFEAPSGTPDVGHLRRRTDREVARWHMPKGRAMKFIQTLNLVVASGLFVQAAIRGYPLLNNKAEGAFCLKRDGIIFWRVTTVEKAK
jgi:hypothetical protein